MPRRAARRSEHSYLPSAQPTSERTPPARPYRRPGYVIQATHNPLTSTNAEPITRDDESGTSQEMGAHRPGDVAGLLARVRAIAFAI